VAAEIEVLKQVEERIQSSLNRIQQLQRENEMLVQRLAESEQRFNEASAELKQQHEARGEIRNRIEQILARFNGLDLGS
jgi:FtsZ-binding cell division protein ZapB